MMAIKQMNSILASNNPKGVDMPLNETKLILVIFKSLLSIFLLHENEAI